jgi:PAS domain S-box-containing protein
MFCDSDDYVLALVSGDIKDLGRISRVSRGIDQLLGFTPEELKGSKIEKIMPSLYAHIHEEFMQGFLKRGYSRFIDKNQFLLA